MRFYDREREIAQLRKMRDGAYNDHSRMSVVTGRRRVGKTSLIWKSFDDEANVYFFVGRKNEASLCDGFCSEVSTKLSVTVPPMKSFQEVFSFLMLLGETRKFTVVVDEFQEFFNINPSVYSDIQNIWDQKRLSTHINLVFSGSVYSLMVKIFQNSHEPLFGRADLVLQLAPFPTTTLKEIMADNSASFGNDDLLALYMVTGGMPKYVELLVEGSDLTVSGIMHYVCGQDSPFKEEGRNLLIDEFGRQYGTYFSIMGVIARGVNTQGEITSALGEKSIGGQLKRLDETYNLIRKTRPIKSKPGTQNVRYEISDLFLRFWFRYFEDNRSLVELNQFGELERIVMSDYKTYSGKILEDYFKQKMAESHLYKEIGSYWEARRGKEQSEIDIVALGLERNKATAVEVKRQRKEYSRDSFLEKVRHLKDKALPKYHIETLCLTIEDM